MSNRSRIAIILSVIAQCAIYWLLIMAMGGDREAGFYLYMRLSVTSLFLLAAYLNRDENKTQFWGYVVCAIIFNPIFKLQVDKDTWELIDEATCTILLYPLVFDAFELWGYSSAKSKQKK